MLVVLKNVFMGEDCSMGAIDVQQGTENIQAEEDHSRWQQGALCHSEQSCASNATSVCATSRNISAPKLFYRD